LCKRVQKVNLVLENNIMVNYNIQVGGDLQMFTQKLKTYGKKHYVAISRLILATFFILLYYH